MESVKICHFKTFRVGNFALRTFCCFFLHYIHVKKFVKIFQLNMSLIQWNLRWISNDLKMNNLDLRGNTMEFKTLPTRPRSHDIYWFIYSRWNLSKFVLLKTFLVRIFARETLFLFRCFNIHVKMCILLSYRARKWV